MSLAPLSSGTYAGISLYQDRTDTSPDTLQGRPGITSAGRYYLPSAQVTIAGNPTSYSSQLICDTVVIQGTGQLNVNYNTAYDIQRHEAFLVQ